MITTFFRNQILPALKIFSNEDVCAWRETRARTYGRTKFCSQTPFHRRFLQRFLRKTRSVRILRREFTKRKRPNSASQNFIPKIFAEIFARGAKREHTRTGTQNSAPKLLFIEDFCRDFCAWRETRARTNGAYQNVRDRERAQCDKATRKKIAKIIPIRWLPAASK